MLPLRILLIEDDADARFLFATVLQSYRPAGTDETPAPPEVVEAGDMESALRLLSESHFDLMVLDYHIPAYADAQVDEEGGGEVIRQALKLDPTLPIIVLTGFGSIELVRQTLTMGAADFLEKSPDAHRELLASIDKVLAQSRERVRRGNPFLYGSEVEPAVFGGREEEFEFFRQRLETVLRGRDPQHFVILGDWGIGKSTLLTRYREICRRDGHLACTARLVEPGGETESAAAKAILGGILRDLPFERDRFIQLERYFEKIGARWAGISSLSLPDGFEPAALLHDTLFYLWADLAEVRPETKVFVILLDDVGNLRAAPQILLTLRQILPDLKKTGLLFGLTSTPGHWSEMVSSARNNPVARFFAVQHELAPLSETELRETVARSIEETGVLFDEEVLSRVYAYTHGHPYEMQVLCHHLFDNELSRRVTAEVWERSFENALAVLGRARFDEQLDAASAEETKVLRVVAESADDISVRDINGRAESGALNVAPANVAKYLQRLVEKELVTRTSRGKYFVPDRMFAAYVAARGS